MEVPLAVTLKELWEIVDTSEKNSKALYDDGERQHGRVELMYLNMCRQGVIGELIHAGGAYIHELRGQMNQVERGTGSWRTHYHAKWQRESLSHPRLGLVHNTIRLAPKTIISKVLCLFHPRFG